MSVYFTDTDCEIWFTDVDKYNINYLAMPYTICGKEYPYDYGRSTDFKDLYGKVRAGEMPTTSALNPQDYIDAFEPYFKKGQDILYVHFSSELSGTFNHLRTAYEELKEKYPERKITMFDTKQICYGAGVLAFEGAKMHNEGASDEEIINRLTVLRDKVRTEFMVDSLSHLRRGGRISGASAVIGTMLNIKPVLECNREGKIVKIGTQHGIKKALEFMVDRMVKCFDFDMEQEIVLADADEPKNADYMESLIRKKLGEGVKIRRLPIGPVIGAHCGPSTIGVIYYSK